MSSPDFAGVRADFARGHKHVQFNDAARFDRGARAFAFCSAVLYAVLSGGLVVAIIKAALQL